MARYGDILLAQLYKSMAIFPQKTIFYSVNRKCSKRDSKHELGSSAVTPSCVCL